MAILSEVNNVRRKFAWYRKPARCWQVFRLSMRFVTKQVDPGPGHCVWSGNLGLQNELHLLRALEVVHEY
jgi:hypothetical protein